MMAILLLGAAGAIGQSPSPGMFNYQGVARNSVGNVLVNKTITLRLTIHDGTAVGPTVYQESRTVTTNPFGLFNVQVGSPGASSVTGTIAGVNWGVGNKYIQVEIDPNGGSTFINIGTAQIASVPYSLYSSLSNDLVLPFIKTQAASGSTLIGITNSATTGTQGALMGTSASTDGNAYAITGTISSSSPGGFSSGVRGINNGTGGLGIGVYGSQNGSGWGVYGFTPSGIGVNGASTSGTGVYGSSNSGNGVNGTSTSAYGVSGSTGASNGAGVLGDGTGTGNSSGVLGRSGEGSYPGVPTNSGVLGRANANVGVMGLALTGTGGYFSSNSGLALNTAGNLRHTGIGEAPNRILATVPGNGDATWVAPAAVGVVTGSGTVNFVPKWTPVGTNLGNSLLFDNGSSMGLGTTTPTHRLDVTHGGSTGIGINSTSGFSVVDINAANGDAALRFGNAGVNQWNMRNRPSDNYLEIFELGGGGSRVVIQDGTGNLGVGETTNPTYKLDVLHGGSTGIRSRSSGSFSVVDIDAASGDAALRFANAGVNQWNIRNRPSDNYLEIFELGGGGSRVVIQDGTGNVGIGQTVAPAYKLDVLHGGATGLRVQSSSSFSVVDIDANSGDAALRFVRAGVNQWNIRNRPADDYLEIFELGGGGSRMVIQDGTGNVGIGQTVSPVYKLDVLHGGSTGLRVQSSASFSVVDIDANSGDAALRFVKAGVNQWNVRNNPGNDDLQIFELGGGGERMAIKDATGNIAIGGSTGVYRLDVLHGGSTGARIESSASFSVLDIDANSGDAALRYIKAGVNQWNVRNNPGTDDYQIFELGGGGERLRIENTTGRVVVATDLHVTGTLSKGGGAFKIDHPMDPENKYLVHSFVESPDMMNIYNGNITTDASGKMTVQLPDYFNTLNKEYRYQLTVIGSFAQAIISKEVNGNSFEISTNQPNVKVSWQVTGVRQDPWANKNRIPNEVEKAAKDKGMYLNPDLYNQPESRRIGYTPEPVESSLNYSPKAVNKPAPSTTGGSLDQPAIVAPANKVVDKSGSVEDVKPADKKAEVKPVDVKGTSVEEVKKPAVQEKKAPASTVPESTKTE